MQFFIFAFTIFGVIINRFITKFILLDFYGDIDGIFLTYFKFSYRQISII